MINYATQLKITIVGQPCDSTYDKQLTTKQYLANLQLCVKTFPQIQYWEVGNEVNGDWLSPTIVEKIITAIDFLAIYPTKLVILTLFWQINTATTQNGVFNWCSANLPLTTRNKINIITLSIYPEQAPLGIAFDQVYSTLKYMFPTSLVAVGELGYWIPNQRIYWAMNQKDPLGKAKQMVADYYYRTAFGYNWSIGGGFWWTFCDDVSTTQTSALQNVFHMIYSDIISIN